MLQRDDINRYLAAFSSDPAEVMDGVPEKRSPGGAVIDGGLSAFDDDTITSGDYVTLRDDVRAGLYSEDDDGETVSVDDIAQGKAPIEKHDRAQDLCDAFKYDRLADMERAGLMQAALPEHPWSDDYWAIYRGVLGHRYGDSLFPESDDWKENYDYIQRHPAAKLI